MLKTEVIHARITPELKHSVEEVLRKVGLSTTDAISLFFHQIVLNEGLPFAVRVPNKDTKAALMDVVTDRHMTTHASLDDLRQKMAKARENA